MAEEVWARYDAAYQVERYVGAPPHCAPRRFPDTLPAPHPPSPTGHRVARVSSRFAPNRFVRFVRFVRRFVRPLTAVRPPSSQTRISCTPPTPRPAPGSVHALRLERVRRHGRAVGGGDGHPGGACRQAPPSRGGGGGICLGALGGLGCCDRCALLRQLGQAWRRSGRGRSVGLGWDGVGWGRVVTWGVRAGCRQLAAVCSPLGGRQQTAGGRCRLPTADCRVVSPDGRRQTTLACDVECRFASVTCPNSPQSECMSQSCV